MSIPFNKPWLPELCYTHGLLADGWESGRISNFGPLARQLEEKVEDLTGRAARSCSSCDTALTLAIAALEIPVGSVVLLPSYSFASTLNAVLWNGLQPHFCDIERDSWNLSAAACIAKTHLHPKLVIATHALGAPAEPSRLEHWTKNIGAKLLFDAASALGGTYQGDRPVGSAGDAECFSLSPTKPLTACEGGMATFREEAVAERFRTLCNYGVPLSGPRAGRPTLRGLNGKLSEAHAAVALAGWGCLPDLLAERQDIAVDYLDRISGSGLCSQVARGNTTWKDFAVLLPSEQARAAAIGRLTAAGIGWKTYYEPLHRSEALRDSSLAPFEHPADLGWWQLPVTEDICSRVLCLPIWNGLGSAAVAEVCSALLGES